MSPIVSVILISWGPTALRMKMLRQTIAGLRQCTKIPYQFIIVDNGPVEHTEYIRLVQPDVHIVNPVNLGPGVARNMGAQAATTPYLAFIDNDLGFYDGWLERALSLLTEFETEFPHAIVAPGRSKPMKRRCHQLGERDGCELYGLAAGWCLVMRKATFDCVGPFLGSDVHPIEDREWGYRARRHGGIFLCPAGPKVRHRGGRHRKMWKKKQRLIDGQWILATEIKERN